MTGVCVIMLIGNKTLEDHLIFSFMARSVAHTSLKMEAGRIVNITWIVLTLIRLLRLFSIH